MAGTPEGLSWAWSKLGGEQWWPGLAASPLDLVWLGTQAKQQ